MSQQSNNPKYIWMDGKLVPFEEATIHVMTPCARYGTNVFEGIRAYWNDKKGELYCFRLHEHYVRLAESMKIMHLQLPYTEEDHIRFLLETLRENELREDTHIRHEVLVAGFGGFGTTKPVSMFIATMPRGRFADIERGIRCCVSSWQRISDNSIPPRVKAGANYHNGHLAKLWARNTGFDEALLLNERGKVAEAPGACLFIVRKGILVTPPVTHGILESITRETIIYLASEELGQKVVEREIDRTELYVAEEAFLCGSGYEIVPVTEIDGMSLQSVQANALTRRIQNYYFETVRGNNEKYMDWLTPVYKARAVG
ncbi:MAG: branched-chain amino acid transaminase [Deltaproteobacteria bacterium]|nr:branched-chain amino acid transaminase [Deltaproteobacteria bacterium]